MTERLYLADAYLRTFTAHVIGQLMVGGQPAVILDRSAFYPEGGGQPSDRGSLNQTAVVEVIAREDDEVLHVLPEAGITGEVIGQIDGTRRFDLMQQHSGQHILSQAFIQAAGAETVSFHLSADPIDGALTIDLNTASLSLAQIEQAEEIANTIVFENRPIQARFVDEEELSALPLRRPPKVSQAIRIVEIKDFDWSACGGTHVAHTGEVGLIKIIKLERRGDEMRVEFRCGRRALIDYRRKNQVIVRVAANLSTGFEELDQAIGRLQSDLKAVRKQLAEADARLQQYEARELLNSSEPRGSFSLIAHTWLDRDAAYLKRMASLCAAQPQTVALLGATGNSTALVFARSKDVSIDLAALLKVAAARLGGKGGGSPDFAQAGGPPVSEDLLKETLAWAQHQIKSDE